MCVCVYRLCVVLYSIFMLMTDFVMIGFNWYMYIFNSVNQSSAMASPPISIPSMVSESSPRALLGRTRMEQ